MKFFPLSIPSSIGNVLGDIAATLPARTWVYVAQLDSCQETFEICSRLVAVGHQESLRRIGQHCALPLSVLDDEDVRNALFVGFDEVYFSLEEFRHRTSSSATAPPAALTPRCIFPCSAPSSRWHESGSPQLPGHSYTITTPSPQSGCPNREDIASLLPTRSETSSPASLA
jgi:hypothetical protein